MRHQHGDRPYGTPAPLTRSERIGLTLFAVMMGLVGLSLLIMIWAAIRWFWSHTV